VIPVSENQCYFCDEEAKSALDKHHSIPKSLNPPEEAQSEYTVCANCHRKLHNAFINPVIRYLNDGRLTSDERKVGAPKMFNDEKAEKIREWKELGKSYGRIQSLIESNVGPFEESDTASRSTLYNYVQEKEATSESATLNNYTAED